LAIGIAGASMLTRLLGEFVVRSKADGPADSGSSFRSADNGEHARELYSGAAGGESGSDGGAQIRI